MARGSVILAQQDEQALAQNARAVFGPLPCTVLQDANGTEEGFHLSGAERDGQSFGHFHIDGIPSSFGPSYEVGYRARGLVEGPRFHGHNRRQPASIVQWGEI